VEARPPHNFKGIGYDGKPAEVSTVTFAFNLHGDRWETISENTFDPRMDTPGVLTTPLGYLVLGGMAKNQAVTAARDGSAQAVMRSVIRILAVRLLFGYNFLRFSIFPFFLYIITSRLGTEMSKPR